MQRRHALYLIGHHKDVFYFVSILTPLWSHFCAKQNLHSSYCIGVLGSFILTGKTKEKGALDEATD
ncbi:Hypothetical protein Minf_0116 [Methylacidiphilum infernorum V4]|uniref:Uncharacterized protein n=1 Tax=Methylacidiphilum infernorum (isolate V4) TaxID=481448 RepID=B3DX36_METI4|nr:Hypothetical protein Minf_0116 [Methylacidiphilum infernorum V4]